MKKVVILGASGHGKVIADIIEKSGDTVVGYLDDDTGTGDSFNGYPMLGVCSDYVRYTDNSFIIAIGNNDHRERISGMMKDVTWYTAIHPSAVISSHAVIGEGCAVLPGAIVNAGARIGNQCIVNSGAIVEHDNYLEDCVHVAVGARVAGTVRIGKKTWIGAGAVVINNINICSDCMIGAGAVVVKDITKPGTYTGVPAREQVRA